MENSNNMDMIGKRINMVRTKLGLTQTVFAASIGISQGNLSEMEKGKFFPSYSTLILLIKKYKVSADWILTGEEVTHKNQFAENPEVKEMHDVIDRVMSDPNSEVRTWGKVQFRKAFAEYFPVKDEKK
ncbi:helix-turn-helix domain-containing protein [Anaerosinus massiliensis]|uniref:helix-turn-helix domain-containing protein n=1 Tax=Massilibacillus massiliensis TaxID=1806837 RepID=UPI000DA62814|nr:helix-turn-helix transcriptional regulator [Massilibacillus massiliensis]